MASSFFFFPESSDPRDERLAANDTCRAAVSAEAGAAAESRVTPGFSRAGSIRCIR
jgi:hypothetical protein